MVTIKTLSCCLHLIKLFFKEKKSNIRFKVLVQIEQAGIPRSIYTRNSEFKLSVGATEAAVVHNFNSFQYSSIYFIILVPTFMF